MDFNYLLKALLGRKWLIITTTFIGFAAGLVFTFFMKKSYVSEAQYSTGLTQTSKVALNTSEVFDINQIDLRFNNVIETFQSPTVLGMLSYELLLHDIENSHPFTELTEKDKKDTAYTFVDFQKAKEILHKKLNTLTLLNNYESDEKRVFDLMLLYEYDDYHISKKLTIERIKNSDFLDILYTSRNPELSAFVVNTIGIKFQEFYFSLTSSRTRESLYKIDSLTKAQQKKVDSLRDRLERFRATNGMSKTGDATGAAISSAAEATTAVTNEQTNLNKLNAQLTAVINQLADLDNNTSNTTTVVPQNNNNAEYLRLKKENENLSVQLAQKGGNDPDIEAKIKSNTTKMTSLSQSTSTGTNPTRAAERIETTRDNLNSKKQELLADIEASKKNISLYENQASEFRRIANSGGGTEVVANAFENDLKSAQDELAKYKSSQFTSQDLEVNPDFNFKQTLIGQPPIKAQPMYRSVIVGVSGIGILFITCIIILILEFLDSSLRSPSIFLRETKLKLLTIVNRMDIAKRPMKENFDMTDVQNANYNNQFFIESFRKLRFELESTNKKIILVTSLKSQEGKSTLLEALAYTFSMTKKKILIIDSNFSNNTITRKFSAKPTLENFSLGVQDNPTDKIWGITTLTDIPNVDIIGCNEGNYTPAEVLPKNNLLSNLNKVGQHYDFIFIEGAALDSHSDSKELSKYADAIMVVFSAKNSLGEIDKESIQFVKAAAPDKFIGAILNNVEKDYLDV